MVNASKMVLTDSGGIQEETSYLGKPCVTIRKNTERPVTLTAGTNMLLSLAAEDFDSQVVQHYKNVNCRAQQPIPFWDDQTSSRIADVMAGVRA